jgi:hypothetical protein
MEHIDQISHPTLLGNDQIAARVDYCVCDLCGFRLKRVETTIINEQHLIVTHCPICEQTDKVISTVSTDDRLQYFDLWLATHGLDRNALEQHYHLQIDDFFDAVG